MAGIPQIMARIQMEMAVATVILVALRPPPVIIIQLLCSVPKSSFPPLGINDARGYTTTPTLQFYALICRLFSGKIVLSF